MSCAASISGPPRSRRHSPARSSWSAATFPKKTANARPTGSWSSPRRGWWRAASCRLARLGASHAEGGTTPGVFVHAAAVQSVLTGNLVRPVPLLGRALAAVLASLGGSLLGFAVTPVARSAWGHRRGSRVLRARGRRCWRSAFGFRSRFRPPPRSSRWCSPTSCASWSRSGAGIGFNTPSATTSPRASSTGWPRAKPNCGWAGSGARSP